MDLYKHAFRLTPLVPSELVADCFELAWDIRVLDMRASPYDFADLGLEPVRIETPEGKQEYVAAQRAFAERGAPLRARLVDECDRLLAVAARGVVRHEKHRNSPESGAERDGLSVAAADSRRRSATSSERLVEEPAVPERIAQHRDPAHGRAVLGPAVEVRSPGDRSRSSRRRRPPPSGAG